MSSKADDTLVSEIQVNDESAAYGSTGNEEQNVPYDTSNIHLKIIMSSLYLNVFLSSLDSTLVSTLFGVIAADLKSFSNISWIATSYLLSRAAFQPLFGKLSDVFGRKSLIQISMLIFAVGCLYCSLSKSLWHLVVARFITGGAAGGMNAMSAITVTDLVPLRKRGLYQGYVSTFFFVGSILGGVVAGMFQQTIGWRASFLVQVPIVLLNSLVVQLFFSLPKGRSGNGVQGQTTLQKLRSLDYVGSSLLVLSLLGLMISFSLMSNHFSGNEVAITVVFLASLAALSCFFFYDLKICADPILPVELLFNKSILHTCIANWFLSMNVFSSTFYIPFYWNSVMNVSPLQCGFRMIPCMIGSATFSTFAGYIIKKTCSYKKLKYVCGILTIVGSVIVFTSNRDESTIFEYFVTVPMRSSSAASITTLLVAIISFVEQKDQALVISIQSCFKSVGSTLGVSISAAILQVLLKFSIASNFGQLKNIPDKFSQKDINDIIRNALMDPNYAAREAPHFFKNAILKSYDFACHGVFVFMFLTAFITFYEMTRMKCVQLRDKN